MGDLAVARSIGDNHIYPWVTYKPFIQECTIGGDDEFLIIGCDGVFDVLTDQQAVDLVNNSPPELASIVLRDHAFLSGSGDNISALVFFLK